MSAQEATITNSPFVSAPKAAREVKGQITAEEYGMLSAMVHATGTTTEQFVSEAVSERVQRMHAELKTKYGPKKLKK